MTFEHDCVERGRLAFDCPDVQANKDVVQNVSLGGVWSSARLSMRHAFGRPATVRTISGGFGVKCRVCGLAVQVLEDRDARAGQLDVLVEFGPNILGGVIAEQNIAGYGIYLVDNCHNRNNTMLAFVPKAETAPWPQGTEGFHVQDACDCPRGLYSARVAGHFPPNPARIMVAPVTDGGYALPVGVTSEVLIDYRVSPTDSLPKTPVVANYGQVTGSFDLALKSPAAAIKFAGDPSAATAVVASLAWMAATEPGNVKVSLSALKEGSNQAGNPSSQGNRRLQGLQGVVRANFGIAFLQQDATGSAAAAQRYPQAFAFAKVLQDSGANTVLAVLVEERLQAASGGVNIYGSLWIEKVGLLKIEEVSAPVSTSTPMLLPSEQSPNMELTVHIVAAASGATGALVCLSVFIMLMCWCCCGRNRAENRSVNDERLFRLLNQNPFMPIKPTGSCMKGELNKLSHVAGQEVLIWSRSQNTWVLGRVRSVGNDGSVCVRYMHGRVGHEKHVPPEKVTTSLRQAYHTGQAVLVFSKEQRCWLDGSIERVNMDASLVIQAEGPGNPERLVIPRTLVKTKVRLLQHKCDKEGLTDSHFSSMHGYSGAFITV